MNKLWLIIQREYLTRVKKKSFILATVLTPLAFGLFFIIVGFIFSYESGDVKKIAISDPGNILSVSKIANTKSIIFSKPQKNLEALKKDVLDKKYDGVIAIPVIKNINDKNVVVDYFYSKDNLDIESRVPIKNSLRRFLRDYKIKELGLDKKQLAAIDSDVTLKTKSILEEDKDTSMNALVGAGIGGMMGMIMYMTVFIYGMMVMQSVREEKVSRIAEVMISSVKPFQLMMGKIIGVGAVGLTQITIWAILIPIISISVQLFFGFDTNHMGPSGMDMANANIDPDEMAYMATQVLAELQSQNWWMIAPLFLLYFLGGYFLYASLFAAVGSAMENDMGEGQALTIPITIPVIIAFYIMIVSVKSPHSSLAIWSSIFPLFSPIVMPARLAFSPPAWQIALSVVVLIATAIFFVWISSRIYRVGILMYGKKVTLKELGKWMFRK
ncbi:MAG TPA: ABC transporter permease [Phaeodactylibacter sp.]|nr:ABC transporter permease [Phaeodactylibacter sp.]